MDLCIAGELGLLERCLYFLKKQTQNITAVVSRRKGVSYIMKGRKKAGTIWNASTHGKAEPIPAALDISYHAGMLLERYGNSILRMAYSYLHNMSDAEDILQDTLIQYIKTAPRLENEAHEKAWLLRVAANLSKNRIRYNKLRETDELEETLMAEEKEDLAFVWDAVKQLPDKYRETIHLYYYEGYSTKEIAEILKKREATIRSLLKRGREQLQGILKEVYDFE